MLPSGLGRCGRAKAAAAAQRCPLQDPKAKGASGAPREITRILDYALLWERWIF